MQIPMNVLTQLTPGSQAGQAFSMKARYSNDSEKYADQFAQVIEQTANRSISVRYSEIKRESSGGGSAGAFDRSESNQGVSTADRSHTFEKPQSVQKSPESQETRQSGETREKQESHKSEDDGIYIASFAGVAGMLNEVNFILEGDKGFNTDPIFASQAVGQIADESLDLTEAVVVGEEVQTTDFETVFETVADLANAQAESSPVQTAIEDRVQKANAQASEVLNDVSETDQTGEVLARTPETAISKHSDMGRDYGEDNPESFENGGLSPLENENDNDESAVGDASGKTKRSKAFSAAVETIRNAAGEQAQVAQPDMVPLSAGIKPEQFKATEQMAQAALSAPVEAGNLFDEMVSRIDMMRTESTQTMTIQLKPEFLGKVDLEIALNASGLHIKIIAEDQGVRSMVNSQINTLIESLTNKGIEVAEVEVSYTGFNNSELSQSRGEQTQPGRTGRQGHAGVNKQEDIAIDTALRPDAIDYYIDTGVSSVEYRA